MQRVYLDRSGVETRALQRREQLVFMRVEMLFGVPDLEHANPVLAVGGVEASSLGLAHARVLEILDHALVFGSRHLVWAYVDGDSHFTLPPRPGCRRRQ